jgi:hypothetical protein
MADLVRSTLRLRPDRIVVGEIRGAEALDMLKAWNTGHPGGIATVHANSAVSALHRIEQLVQESVTTVPRALIAEAIDLIIFIAGRGHARRVETVLRVNGLRPDGAYDLAALARDTRLNPHHTSMEIYHDECEACFPCAAATGQLNGCSRCPFARPGRRGIRLGHRHALGDAAQQHPRIRAGAGGQDHRGDRHHHHRPEPGLR